MPRIDGCREHWRARGRRSWQDAKTSGEQMGSRGPSNTFWPDGGLGPGTDESNSGIPSRSPENFLQANITDHVVAPALPCCFRFEVRPGSQRLYRLPRAICSPYALCLSTTIHPSSTHIPRAKVGIEVTSAATQERGSCSVLSPPVHPLSASAAAESSTDTPASSAANPSSLYARVPSRIIKRRDPAARFPPNKPPLVPAPIARSSSSSTLTGPEHTHSRHQSKGRIRDPFTSHRNAHLACHSLFDLARPLLHLSLSRPKGYEARCASSPSRLGRSFAAVAASHFALSPPGANEYIASHRYTLPNTRAPRPLTAIGATHGTVHPPLTIEPYSCSTPGAPETTLTDSFSTP